MSGIRSRGRRGSTAVPNWRCEDTRLDVFDFRIAVWLASHADTYLADNVGRNEIVTVLGISRSKVSDSLSLLQELGIIELIEAPNGRGGGYRWVIVFDWDVWETEPDAGRHTSSSRTPHVQQVGRQASSSIGEQEEGRELSKESSRGELGIALHPEWPEGRVATTRARNDLFDACVGACGWSYEEMTERQRKACGVAVAQLKAVGATPEEIARRSLVYRQVYPDAALTPNALANQWAAIASVPEKVRQNSHSTDALLNVARKRGLG